MHSSLKIASLLLSYPSADLQQGIPELTQALMSDQLTGKAEKQALSELAENIASLDLYDAQERYVYLFDRTRSLSLHLFEHIHGESRDRGQAMVNLMELYQSNGLSVDVRELPDYLPLFLEYLSTRPTEEVCGLLGQTAHILAALAKRLRKRESPYANVFEVLVALGVNEPDKKQLDEMLAQDEDDPSDLEALDRIWSEEAVTFGGAAEDTQHFGVEQLRDQLKAGSLNNRHKAAEQLNGS